MAKNEEVFKLRTESDTSGLEDAQNAIDDLTGEAEKLVDQVIESGDVAEEAEGKFGSFVTNALAGFAKMAGAAAFNMIADQITGFVSDTMEWEGAFNQLQAATHSTDAEMEALKDNSFDVYAKGIGDNVTAVTDAMAIAEQQTGAFGDELENITGGALTLNKVLGTDIGGSISATDAVMTNFGATGTQVMDMLASTITNVGDPAGDLVGTVSEFSPIFEQMGYGAGGMFAVLQGGSEAGIQSFQKIADAMKEFNTRTLEGSDETKQAYNDLIKSVDGGFTTFVNGAEVSLTSYDDLQAALNDGSLTMAALSQQVGRAMEGITDPIEQNRIGVALLGSKWEDLGPAILGAMDPAPIEDYTGAMSDMQKTTQKGIMPALDRLERMVKVKLFQAFEPFIIGLIDDAIPAIEDFSDILSHEAPQAIAAVTDKAEELGAVVLPPLSEAVDFLSEKFNENKDTLQTFGEFFGKAVAVAGGAVATIAGVTAAISGMGVVAGAAAAGFALLTSPIAILIALLVGFQAAYSANFMGFGDAVNDTVDTAKAGFDRLVGFVTGLIDAFKTGGLEGAGDFIKTQLIDPLVAGIEEYVSSGQLMEDASALGANILVAIGEGLALADDAASWLETNLITPLADAAAAYISTGKLRETMYALGKGLMDGIKIGIVLLGALGVFIATNVIEPLAAAALEYVTSGALVDNLKTLGHGVWDAIKAGISLDIAIAQFVLDNIVTPFGDGVIASATDPKFVSALKDLGVTALGYLKDGLVFAGDWVLTNLINPLAGLISGVSLDGVKTAMTSIGTTMMDALEDAISAAAGGIESAVKDAINTAIPDHIGFHIGEIKAGPVTLYGGGDIGIDVPNPFRQGTPWTGFGALDQVAGIVHRQEAVVPAHGMAVYPSPNGLMLAGAGGGYGGYGGQPIVMDITIELDGEVIFNRMEDIRKRRAP